MYRREFLSAHVAFGSWKKTFYNRYVRSGMVLCPGDSVTPQCACEAGGVSKTQSCSRTRRTMGRYCQRAWKKEKDFMGRHLERLFAVMNNVLVRMEMLSGPESAVASLFCAHERSVCAGFVGARMSLQVAFAQVRFLACLADKGTLRTP
jgi:hypothetical protein